MTTAKDIAKCPICDETLSTLTRGQDPFILNCPRCGVYKISLEAIEDTRSLTLRLTQIEKATLSHNVKVRAFYRSEPTINFEQLKAILKEELPKPQEQLNNLVLWIGNNITRPNEKFHADKGAISAIGAVDNNGLAYIVNFGIQEGYFSSYVQNQDASQPTIQPIQMTLKGWQYFYDLQKGNINRTMVFMAMPFNNPILESNYLEHWKPALLDRLGLNLKKLNENQPAGLIDDQIRVEIRQSKFLIADLTGGNEGAYWEAGYAEGLGKRVIYLCEHEYFDSNRTHFDTNHHLTVMWDLNKMDESVNNLISTIKATFPDEYDY